MPKSTRVLKVAPPVKKKKTAKVKGITADVVFVDEVSVDE